MRRWIAVYSIGRIEFGEKKFIVMGRGWAEKIPSFCCRDVKWLFCVSREFWCYGRKLKNLDDDPVTVAYSRAKSRARFLNTRAHSVNHLSRLQCVSRESSIIVIPDWGEKKSRSARAAFLSGQNNYKLFNICPALKLPEATLIPNCERSQTVLWNFFFACIAIVLPLLLFRFAEYTYGFLRSDRFFVSHPPKYSISCGNDQLLCWFR